MGNFLDQREIEFLVVDREIFPVEFNEAAMLARILLEKVAKMFAKLGRRGIAGRGGCKAALAHRFVKKNGARRGDV